MDLNRLKVDFFDEAFPQPPDQVRYPCPLLHTMNSSVITSLISVFSPRHKLYEGWADVLMLILITSADDTEPDIQHEWMECGRDTPSGLVTIH